LRGYELSKNLQVSIRDDSQVIEDLEEGFIAVIPPEIPVKEGPLKNISDLKPDKELKENLHASFLEMQGIIDYSRRTSYKGQYGEEKKASLLSVIENTWKNYLSNYIYEVNDDNETTTVRDDWWIIYGIAKIFEKENLSEAFLTLQEEGRVPFSAIYFEENGELKHYRPDGKIRGNSQTLAYNGLARYVPKPPFGWVPNKLSSQNKFHETIKRFIKEYIKRYEERNEPVLLLYWAIDALECYKKRKLSKDDALECYKRRKLSKDKISFD